MNKDYIPIKWLTPAEFNRLFDKVIVTKRKYTLDISITRINLTVYNEQYIDKFSVDLVSGEIPPKIPVATIASKFKKIVPIIDGYGKKEEPDPTFELPGHTKITWDYLDPGNYSYTNDKYKLKWLNCYSYDVHSAYSLAMKKPMPDTSKPKFNAIVGPGEMGFRKLTKLVYIVSEGKMADVVFPLMESPYKDYVDEYYLKKQNAKTEVEYDLYKAWLNIPAGLLHRYNIFHRLAMLYYAKKYIMQFIDENTVYCNVDSIISLKPRNDLPIGDGLGEFKIEHQNERFKFKKVAIYQWGNEVHYSGIPSKAINDIEDIKSLNQFTKYYYKEGYIWPINADIPSVK